MVDQGERIPLVPHEDSELYISNWAALLLIRGTGSLALSLPLSYVLLSLSLFAYPFVVVHFTFPLCAGVATLAHIEPGTSAVPVRSNNAVTNDRVRRQD